MTPNPTIKSDNTMLIVAIIKKWCDANANVCKAYIGVL